MFKAFSKVLILSLLVVALAAPAFATTARVNSLAGTGDYMNDDSNMFRWYGVLPSYANLVMMEVGSWDGNVDHRGIGVTHACGDEGKWGTWGFWLLEDAVNDDSFFMMSLFHTGTDHGLEPLDRRMIVPPPKPHKGDHLSKRQ